MLWSFGKSWLVGFLFIELCDMLHYTVAKTHIYPCHYWSHQKLFRSCQAHSGRYEFSKIPIFIRKFEISSLATHTVNCSLWSDSLSLFIFEKMFAKHSSVNDDSLIVVVLSKNTVLQACSHRCTHKCKNSTSFPYNSNGPGLEWLYSFNMKQKALSIFHTLLYRLLRWWSSKYFKKV